MGIIAETSIVYVMLQDLVKKLLYACGVLGLYHRLRNADTLTVVMFHRVLTREDARWASSDPDYTLSAGHFAEALAFFARHYNVVSLEQVLDSAGRGIALPPRSLLITFDDGWSDNVDHALPELRLVGMPAVMFVVADAVGTRQPFFQERIVAAWRRGAITVEGLAAALDGPRATDRSGDEEDISMLRKAIARIELLDGAARDALLAPFADALDDGQRHMVDVDELRRLRAGGVALGLHGKTHVPMTRAADLDAELGGARERLAELLGDPSPTARSMSFPHGAYDPGIADSARRAGYDLVCTSVPVLNPVGPGVGWLMGRIGFDTESVVDRAGRFRRDWLALYMFRPPARRLA